jgi:hypothetical protein
VKRWNYDAPKLALDVQVDYRWSLIGPDGRDMFGSQRIRTWRDLRLAREEMSSLLAKGFRIAVSRRVEVWETQACRYCQARPCAIDYDIEGPYLTVTCETDQCRQGHNPDNHDWVAGKGPLWGPDHLEWQAIAV